MPKGILDPDFINFMDYTCAKCVSNRQRHWTEAGMSTHRDWRGWAETAITFALGAIAGVVIALASVGGLR